MSNAVERLRPVLRASDIERIERYVRMSCNDRQPVELKLYDRLEDLTVIGVVERIDAFKRRFCVNGDWFRLDDVTDAALLRQFS